MEDNEYREMFAVEDTHWWFVARRLFLSKIFAKVGISPDKTAKIADIGAGTGGMYAFLSGYGSVVGVEPNEKGRKRAKFRGMRVVAGRAEKTTLGTRSINVVCILDVLYHKNIDEKKALQEAYRILKPGGWLVVTDCAFPWLRSTHDVAVQGARRYTKKTLRRLIERAGFRVRYATYTFFFVFPLFAMWRIGERIIDRSKTPKSDVKASPRALNGVLTGMCWVEAYLLSFVMYPWGSSVVVIVQKR